MLPDGYVGLNCIGFDVTLVGALEVLPLLVTLLGLDCEVVFVADVVLVGGFTVDTLVELIALAEFVAAVVFAAALVATDLWAVAV